MEPKLEVKWKLPAMMYVERLTTTEQARVRREIEEIAERWPLESPSLRLVSRGATGSIYLLRVNSSLRAVLSVEKASVTVLDIVPAGQIERLRTLNDRSS